MKPKTVIFLVVSSILVIGILIFAGWYFLFPFEEEDEVKTIGIAGWNSDLTYSGSVAGFKEGLAENGYVEGENVMFIIKNAESDLEIQRQIIESFVEAKVDIIYSLTTPGTLIAQNVTSKIPIVFSIVTYPVEAGIIDSLESSGNNIVGTRNFVSVKRQYSAFEKIYSNTKTLAFVHREGEPNSVAQHLEMKALLEKKRINVIDIAAVDLADMRAQLESNIDAVDSLFSACDTLINVGGEEIVIEISKKHKKPNFSCLKGSVLKGALMGNIADFYVIGKISGRQAALIFSGANPSSLLTESPEEDYIIVNTKTAAEIGLEIPQYVLNDAQEIVG